jgi:hypothetical protein
MSMVNELECGTKKFHAFSTCVGTCYESTNLQDVLQIEYITRIWVVKSSFNLFLQLCKECSIRRQVTDREDG